MSNAFITDFIIWLAQVAGKINQIARCVIGYPSGQDEAVLPPLRTARRVPREKFSRKPNNKPFIDQVFLVKMAGYWPRSFLRVYGPPRMDRDGVDVDKHAKRTWPISSHLDLTVGHNPYVSARALTCMEFSVFKNNHFCLHWTLRDVARSAQLSPRRHGPCRSVQAAQPPATTVSRQGFPTAVTHKPG